MSMNIGLSGLRATSEQLSTVSHNIANAGTVGFKSSRTEFQDLYAPQYGGGEMNGVEVARVRQTFNMGTTTPTGRNGDLAINGEGFFMVKGSDGQNMYTRNGMFNMDSDGNLVSGDGARLLGFAMTTSGNLQTGNLSPLKIDMADMPAKSTSKIKLGLNLDANAPIIDTKIRQFDPEDPSTFTSSTTTTVYDSIGVGHELTQYYVKTDHNKWEVHYRIDGATPDEPVLEKKDANGNVISSVKGKSELTFDEEGKFVAITPSVDGTNEQNVKVAFKLPNGSIAQSLEIPMLDCSQFGNDFAVNTNSQDGYASGQVAGWYFDSDGGVYTRYSNGLTQQQGQVALARFPNQEGLDQAGGTAWSQTFASGAPIVGSPGTGQLGALRTGMYENSNVDLTGEMVNLMAAQSNYQANAKTIQVTQEMTQVLFQSL